MKVLILMTLVAVICTALPSYGAQKISYEDLTQRLHDLKRFAVPPVEGEKSGSVTSYDRASTYDAARDVYVNWYANDDGSGVEKMDGESAVAADLKGPGVIWRIWSAQADGGHIRIIVDGAEQPALDIPFNSLFDAEHGPFPFKNLIQTMARGHNCFVPIPYQKSCKIMLDKGWGRYYQITYTQFPAGTQVPSFHGTFDDAETAALRNADRIWADRNAPKASPQAETIHKKVTLAPGKSVEIVTLDSPHAITGITCSVNETEATSMEKALREVAISCYWDGEKKPSVWSPLGDFFGSGPGLNPYRSLPSGVTKDGMYSAWYMPFNKAIVRLANDGAVPRTISIAVSHEPLAQSADGLLRFHAKWHRDHWGGDTPVGSHPSVSHGHGIVTGVGSPGRYAKDRWPDWPMLLAHGGPGRFCGVALHIWNPLHVWDAALANHYVRKVSELCPDPEWFKNNVMRDYWWGEGDEKFFVDGEKFPSTFGTGSEDYFGYAWGTPEVFDSATQCQTRNSANTGHLSMARWHVADDVPFQHSFEASIEKYHGNNWPLHYAVTVYWYQAAGVADEYPALPIRERQGYYTLPEMTPAGP